MAKDMRGVTLDFGDTVVYPVRAQNLKIGVIYDMDYGKGVISLEFPKQDHKRAIHICPSRVLKVILPQPPRI